jgi:hypothetical protein
VTKYKMPIIKLKSMKIVNDTNNKDLFKEIHLINFNEI